MLTDEQAARRAGQWVERQWGALFTGAVLGAILVTLTLRHRKRKGKFLRFKASQIKPNLNMERYIFDIATSDGDKQAMVESNGSCYSVRMEGLFLGTMWQDSADGMQWKTEDQALEKHLEDISSGIAMAFSRNGFSTILKGTYPEIIKTIWKTSETLEVILDADTDLDLFCTFLQDEVMNLVDFEEHLDLVVKKSDNAYFKIIGIN